MSRRRGKAGRGEAQRTADRRPVADGPPPGAKSGRPAARSFRLKRAWIAILAGVFVVSLGIRLYGCLTFGFGMDGEGSFQMINFDEGNACRGVMGDKRYPRFVGYQIIAIARLTGHGPTPEDYRAGAGRAYCQSRSLTLIQRIYSAVTGALTVVLVALLALMMWPARPEIAWTASGLLAVSNLHIAHSHYATVDGPQVFFITLFLTVLTYGLLYRRKVPLYSSPLFLAAAVLTKYWVAAVFAYTRPLLEGSLRRHWQRNLLAALAAALAVVLIVGWHTITDIVGEYGEYLTSGKRMGRFGTEYGNIGIWRRWIRNAVNLPLVHIVGLGTPAFVLMLYGLRRVLADRQNRWIWQAHFALAVYAAYMLLIAPVTWYRHYLPFFPTAVLLAAYGFWETRWATGRLAAALLVAYPLLLTVDSEYNYRFDPRRELRGWYAEHDDPRVLATYYVNPPDGARRTRLFQMPEYLRYGASYLQQADYLILSDNWYFHNLPNEINGPIAWRPEWLIRTTPEEARAYWKILGNRDPNLRLAAEFNMKHFTPEMFLHRLLYGSVHLFVGDLKIYAVQAPG